jgi:hypothetical protein
MTRTLTARHNAAMTAGRRRKARERRREREQRLRQLGLEPVKRESPARQRPSGWYWQGVRYPEIDSMIRRMVEHYEDKETS